MLSFFPYPEILNGKWSNITIYNTNKTAPNKCLLWRSSFEGNSNRQWSVRVVSSMLTMLLTVSGKCICVLWLLLPFVEIVKAVIYGLLAKSSLES